MAGPHEWLDRNDDYQDTTNWSTGLVPASGETARFLQGSKRITQNVNQSAVTTITIETGPEWYGQLGQLGAPLRYGSGTAVKFASPQSQQNFLSFSGGTLAALTVLATAKSPYALSILAGTVTDTYVQHCGNIWFDAATFTRIRMATLDPTANLAIGSGAAVGTIIQNGGEIDLYDDVDTLLKIVGGVCTFKRSSGGTMALIEQYSGSEFKWNAPGSVITKAEVYGGFFNARENAAAKTLTNADVYTGGVMDLDNGPRNFTISNAIKQYGGVINGTSNISVLVAGGLPR